MVFDQRQATQTIKCIFYVVRLIPAPTQLPSDSALGKKENLVESLVELEVVQIVPDESIGRFGLHPSQLEQGDLKVTTDYRDVVAEILEVRMGNTDLPNIFPNYTPTFIGITN